MNIVRTRFAPSPTGFLHIGGLRTALYAYAMAKHEGGDFILRIEDTDQKREVPGAVDALINTLAKFGLKHDEIYKQSERLDKYKEAAEKLVREGHAFYCDCKSKNAKEEGYSTSLRDSCRDKKLTTGAIKLKVPDNEALSYYDFIHKKEISWQSNTVYDATLLKSDGFPTYHLAVAVDDLDMKISHILRGHDWLPSTPIHLLVFKYLGNFIPQIGHATDILSSETGKKLSKRRDSVFVEQFLEEGYLPEALLNFIMLLGWAPKDNRELFTLDEFVEKFDIKGFQDANPRFFREKLDWFNGMYIREKTNDELFLLAKKMYGSKYSDEKMRKIIPLVKERIKKISDIEGLAEFVLTEKEIDPLIIKTFYDTRASGATISNLQNIQDWNIDSINESLNTAVTQSGLKTGDYYMGLRTTLSGVKFTPPINESIEILGKEITINRLKKGEEKYKQSK